MDVKTKNLHLCDDDMTVVKSVTEGISKPLT